VRQVLHCVARLPALFLVSLVAGGCSTTSSGLITRPQSVAWNVDPAIPDAIRAPKGHVLLGHAVGRGVATFTSEVSPTDPNHAIWVVTHDEGGDLLDDWGHRIGHHEGNNWSIEGGSGLTSASIAQVPMRRTAPWKLMATTSHSGNGHLSHAEFIEQLHTFGGPAATARNELGTQVRAEYSADYYFYGAVAPQTRTDR
jgi:hypothetical protein